VLVDRVECFDHVVPGVGPGHPASVGPQRGACDAGFAGEAGDAALERIGFFFDSGVQGVGNSELHPAHTPIVLTFDWRGTGLSDPVARAPTFDEHMNDMRAVMAAAGCERAAVLGFSAGGLLAALFAATHPERTEALILWDGFATVNLHLDDEPDREVWPRLRRLHLDALEHWGEGRFLYMVAPTVADNAEIRGAYGQFERAAVSPAMARALFEAVEDADIRPLLPEIEVATLVIDHPDAPLYAQRGRYLAERVPGARLVELEGLNHLPLVGPQVIGVADVVEDFLARRRGTPDPTVASASG
jgi:pimeloyl-ACP methyl ester carboxylesterase